MLGASNLMAGLATLFRHTDEILLTRAHLPIVRSIQEHIGQMIWLLSPGAVVVHEGDPTPPESEAGDRTAFAERTRRAVLMHRAMTDDACSACALTYGVGSDQHNAAVAGRAGARISLDALPEGGGYPTPTVFAKLTQDMAFESAGHPVSDASKEIYKRLSESSHGTLHGLLGEGLDQELKVIEFRQNNDELEELARLVGIWWEVSTKLLAQAHGWDWPSEFSAFAATMRTLFD